MSPPSATPNLKIMQELRSESGGTDIELLPDRVAALNREFVNLPAIATLDRPTVLFKTGRARTTHTLKNLTPE